MEGRRTMRAVKVFPPGSGSQLRTVEVPVPEPGPGQVLVEVHYTSVISSEVATRHGVSTAKLPLILGNDFVGIIIQAPSAPDRVGSRVVGAYGGYGYVRDGAWAEYILVESSDVFEVESHLDDNVLASIPGSFTAASGSLHALGDLKGKTILIHGGTSGVGLAAATLAAADGAVVIATTRWKSKVEQLRHHGVHHVVVDEGELESQVKAIMPDGVDLVLELLGVQLVHEALRCIKPFGIACLTGILNDQTQSIQEGLREDRSENVYPHPMELVPATVRLTTGGVAGTPRTAEMVQAWVEGLESGLYRMPVDSTFSLDEISDALNRRTDPTAFGKILVKVHQA